MPVVINGTSGITGNSGTVISASTIGVGGATPAASGAGITFPATQSDSSDANTLDDYEEGTWTPDLRFGGSTTGITYAAGGQVGRYTKIGNMVYAGFYIELTSKGSASGQARLYGMPFASVNSEAGRMGTAAGYYANFNSAVTTILLMMETNQTNATLRYGGAGSATDLTAALFNNNIGLYGVFIYQV